MTACTIMTDTIFCSFIVTESYHCYSCTSFHAQKYTKLFHVYLTTHPGREMTFSSFLCVCAPPAAPPQDPGAAGERRAGHPEAEVVAPEGSLRPGQPVGRAAGGARPETAQLRGGLLHPGGGAAAGLSGGRPGDMVEQPAVPPGSAQRGDHREGDRRQTQAYTLA